jgi:electron transfer flavoprotein alpha subunit
LVYESGILVLGEVDDSGKLASSTRALCGLANGLAVSLGAEVCAALLGSGVQDAAEELAACGPARVLVAEDETLSVYNPDIHLPLIKSLCESEGPRVVLVAHSTMGQDLAPRLSYEIGGGVVTDCVGISVDGGAMRCSKPIYGGNVIAGYSATVAPLVVTVRSGVGDAPAPGAHPAGTVEALGAEVPTTVRAQVKERIRETGEEISLEEAPAVISGGRGMGGPEGFGDLSKLAGVLGAAVGASRPPVDSGWVPSTSQVGITGKIISPELYVAVAISGSSQHLSGMADSRTVVAINNDPDAYIFKVSDYGVVGDWRSVLPAFTEKLAGLLKGGEQQ